MGFFQKKRFYIYLGLFLGLSSMHFYQKSKVQYRGPQSLYFNGSTFFNPQRPEYGQSPLRILKLMRAKYKEWPFKIQNDPKKIKNTPEEKDFSVTFINHSTTLIQLNGLRILTDPIWSEYCSPVQWAGPQRVRNPGVNIEDLERVDVVLISHNHYDHLDFGTLKKLKELYNPLVLVGAGSAPYFEDIAYDNFKELIWNQSHNVRGTEFYFVRAQHWSKRSLWDTNKALWGSFVIKGASHTLFFAGDTGYSEHIKEIAFEHGPFDLSLIPIGAYEPRWFMKFAHMNPEESVKTHLDLESKNSLGIHFGTFQLTTEGIEDPRVELKKAMKKQRIPASSFIVPKFGETYHY